MLSDDPNIFFSDFGVAVEYAGLSGLGIFDSPAEIVSEGMIIATDYSVLVRTDEFGSVHAGEPISVGGETYIVREPTVQADGVFTKITLSKDLPFSLTEQGTGDLLDRVVNVDLPEDT